MPVVAFRDKVRKETVAGRQVLDPLEYEARVKHAFEVAEVLRKNVVQAVKQGQGEDAAWSEYRLAFFLGI